MNNYHPVEASHVIRFMWTFVLLATIGIVVYWPLHYWVPTPLALGIPQGTAYSLTILHTLFVLTSLSSFHHWRKNSPQWRSVAIASLVFAMSSGVVGTASLADSTAGGWPFWVVSIAFTICPIIFLRRLSREWRKQATIGH